MSREEFGIIARTMLEVFPQVTVWRLYFLPDQPIVALVAGMDQAPLDREVLHRRHILRLFAEPDKGDPAEQFLTCYCGNLSAASGLVENYPLNTDDRPRIEYGAPITHRRVKAEEMSWLVGSEFIAFLDDLLAAVPPERDPYLRALSGRKADLVRAGLSFHRAKVLQKTGDQKGAKKAMDHYHSIVKAGE